MQPKRTRRSAETVRTLILNAARELFSERGYSGTATREIAARAGVAEVLLFRHFGSKANLFQQTVFEPLNRYIREFQVEHLERGDAAPGTEPETQDFIAGLRNLLSTNRQLLMSAIAADMLESEVADGLRDNEALREYFLTAERYLEPNRDKYLVDLPLGVRFSFATALGVALFQDWLFADMEKQPDPRQFLTELTTYMLGGLEGSHGTKAMDTSQSKPQRSPGKKKID